MAYKIYGTNESYNGLTVEIGGYLYTTVGGALEGNSLQLVPNGNNGNNGTRGTRGTQTTRTQQTAPNTGGSRELTTPQLCGPTHPPCPPDYICQGGYCVYDTTKTTDRQTVMGGSGRGGTRGGRGGGY